MSIRAAITAILLVVGPLSTVAARFDRRIVDTVEGGNAISEANHGYEGSDDTTGVFGGKSFRQTRGFMRYAMTTFDDTEVTVACTFVATDGAAHGYDIVVEDSVIATRTFTARGTTPQPLTSTTVEVGIPFVLTRGKTNIAVILRARGGSTPALQQLRTVQNHNELQ